MSKLLPPRGCRDVLPPAAASRRALTNLFARHAALFNFRELQTPVLEPASIYASLGPSSDVMSKEIYRVVDTHPPLVLRPEGTAGVARALHASLAHSAPPARVWYAGPMFRRERPQAGRLRQFTQFGAELMTSTASATAAAAAPPARAMHDALVVELAARFLADAGVRTRLRLNWLGSPDDRARYSAALADFLAPRRNTLSDASRCRLDTGHAACLRVLDSKDEADRDALTDAPRLRDFVSPDEAAHARRVAELLHEAGVAFVVDPRLVRGLDYYTGTAFEFDAGADGKAVCAGGRYVDVIGGVCGVGFALGVERLELAQLEARADVDGGVREEEEEDGRLEGCVAVVSVGAAANETVARAVRRVTRRLRAEGVAAEEVVGTGKIGKLLGRVIRDGARAVVMVGDDEAASGTVQVKVVRRGGEQECARIVDESRVGAMVKTGTGSDRDPLRAALS